MDFQLWQGMEPPFASVPLETNTPGFNKNILQPGPHMTDHSFRLSVSNVYHQRLGSATIPEWDSINNRFLEVNETLDQVIIHPTSVRPT